MRHTLLPRVPPIPPIPPAVSALVLNYRSPKETVHCVRALKNQSVGDQLEILIIENHSQDDSIGVIRNTFEGHANVQIIETSKNLGYGNGNNRGNRYAEGQFLLIINPDNTLESDGLKKMIRVMEEDESIGIVAPKLVHEDGSVRESARRFPSPFDVIVKRTFLKHLFSARLHHYLGTDTDQSAARDVDWVVGACFLIRRDLFESLGGFDPRFFLFFEDIDLCRRVTMTGKRVVYDPRITATDRTSRLSEGGLLTLFTKKTVRIHLLSALKYFWKWRSSASGY